VAADARRAGLLEASRSADPQVRAKAAEIYERLYDEPPPSVADSAPIADPMAAAAQRAAKQNDGVDWGKALSGAASSVSDFVTGPLQAGVAKWNDRMTLGLYPAAMDLLGVDNPQRRADLAKKHPIGDMIGDGASMVTAALSPAAPAAMVDRAVAQMAGPLTRAVSPLGRAAAATATNATAGALTGALESTVKGDGLAGAAPGAVSGVVGTGLGALMRGGAASTRAASPNIKDFAEAKRAGAYDRPELKAVEDIHGGLGARRAAENAHEAIVGRDSQIVAGQKATYQEAIAPFLDTNLSREQAQKELLKRFADNLDPRTGAPYDEALDTAYRDVADFLGGVRPGKPGLRGGKPHVVVTPNEPAPTLEGANRKALGIREAADFESMAPTPANRAAQKAYGVLKTAIDSSVPAPVVAARKEAATNAAEGRRRRDIVYNTEAEVTRPSGSPRAQEAPLDTDVVAMNETLGADPTMRVAKEKAAATFLGRVGDDNVPGHTANKYLRELSDMDPEFARQLAIVRAKKAREAVRFSMKGLVPTDLTGSNEASGFGPFIRQNMRSVGAQLVEPVLEGAGKLLPRAFVRGAPVLRDPIDAAMGRRKKEKKK
jgi:hypothetical protein